MADVHHFIWDRTRAIRNDFSIQQVSKVDDVRIAINCYECIARFHIVSLHQLALPEKPYEKYDSQQEREQLDKTLLSLMQLYDDNRKNVKSANEAEFRAYCIIFQIQDPVPDLEDRVQTWPEEVLNDGRITRALAIYAAACNTSDAQGPLKPRATHPIARANWRRFWQIVRSSEISYCMACVSEIYFPLIRRITLNGIWRSFRAGGSAKSEDWSLSELVDVFGMDNRQDAAQFCKDYGFVFTEAALLDLTSVTGKDLPEPTRKMRQLKSLIVERKRHNRTLSAIINGMSVRAAEEAGLIEQPLAIEDQDMSEEDSLFVPENPTTRSSFMAQNPVVATPADDSKLDPFASAFSPLRTTVFLTPDLKEGPPATVSTSQPKPAIPTFGATGWGTSEGQKKAIAIANDGAPDKAKVSGPLFGASNSGEPCGTMPQWKSPFESGQALATSTSTSELGTSLNAPNNIASSNQPGFPAVNTKGADSASGPSSPFNFNTNKPISSTTPTSFPFTFGSYPSAGGLHSDSKIPSPFASTTVKLPAIIPTDSTPAFNIPAVGPPQGTFTFPSTIVPSSQNPRPDAVPSLSSATPTLSHTSNTVPSHFPSFGTPSAAVQASTPSFNFTPTAQPPSSPASNNTLAVSAAQISQAHARTNHIQEHGVMLPSIHGLGGLSPSSLASTIIEASSPTNKLACNMVNANSATTTKLVAVTKTQRSRVLRELSQKLLLGSGGYLEQYVEYITNPIIARVQDDLAAQRLYKEAGKLHPSFLNVVVLTRL